MKIKLTIFGKFYLQKSGNRKILGLIQFRSLSIFKDTLKSDEYKEAQLEAGKVKSQKDINANNILKNI